jgi:hypothetical protein
MIFILILSFFCPFFKIGSVTFPLSYFVISIIGTKGLVNIIKFKENRFILIPYGCYLIYTVTISFLHFFINQSLDLRGISGAIMGILAIGSAFYLANKFAKYELGEFLILFNYPLLINNAIILLIFNIPQFKIFFYDVVAVNPKIHDYPIPRYSGLVYDGFSFASTLNAIYFLIIFFIASYFWNVISFKVKSIILFNLFVTVLTTILVGRTGVGLIFIGLAFFLLYDFLHSSLVKKLFFILKSSLTLIILMSIILLIYIFLYDFPIFEYLTYGLRFYVDIFNTGELNDSSLNDISNNMYFLPEGIFANLFGIGNFGRGKEYIESDIGLVLGIHGFGIIGVILYLFSLIFILFHSIYKLKNKINSYKVITIVLFIIIVNAKDYYIFYPIGHYILIFSFLFYLRILKIKYAF